MENIKRTRAVSKKEKKVTAADDKAHHSNAAKRKRIEVSITTQSANPHIIPMMLNSPISTPPPSTIVSNVGNLPLPKQKYFIQ